MTDNFYKSEIDRELLLNIEIQKQNLKALPDKFKAQKKVVSPVTQQMIDDYKKQFRDLYKRKDAKGTEQFFKFLIPDALPTLEERDYTSLKPELNPDDINAKNKELDDLILEYKDQEQGLRDEYRIIEESKNEINKLTAKLNIRTQYDKEYFILDEEIKNNEERKKISEDIIPEIIIRLENITTKIN